MPKFIWFNFVHQIYSFYNSYLANRYGRMQTEKGLTLTKLLNFCWLSWSRTHPSTAEPRCFTQHGMSIPCRYEQNTVLRPKTFPVNWQALGGRIPLPPEWKDISPKHKPARVSNAHRHTTFKVSSKFLQMVTRRNENGIIVKQGWVELKMPYIKGWHWRCYWSSVYK